MPNQLPRWRTNRRLAWSLTFVAAASLSFGFALVPLYDTLCRLTGLNGKTGEAATVPAGDADLTRLITVEFTSTVMPGLPWQFQPTERRLQMRPGEPAATTYVATNLSGRPIDGQAVMSVTPEVAAIHLKKIECFCFRRQPLQPQETRTLPLVFFVSPDLPEDVRTITVSYAVFPAPEQGSAENRSDLGREP